MNCAAGAVAEDWRRCAWVAVERWRWRLRCELGVDDKDLRRKLSTQLATEVFLQFPVMLSGHGLQFAGLDIVDKASDVDVLGNERRIAQEGDVVAHGLFQVLEREEGDVVCVSR